MASQLPLPPLLQEQVATWHAETYLPPKEAWMAEGGSEQGWWDTLVAVRGSLAATDPADWPR
jgi:hypothetical protein